ncbi:MAG: NAD(P)-dependent alcohol dehydrogenase [Gammaproteobacteria bacterium]|nr:NAD(P)-dependent alcohol dehydrogenase [Gammaproteobacteria bacterium]MCP4981682.1 NAD(P)-dependent alcohol dehydrogenase [Gammaproteobacteria bacterium]
MRAYEIVSDRGVDALALNERQTPTPGNGEILVAMRASAINYRDLSTIEDPLPRSIFYPRIPNSDGAGEVIGVGAGVTRFKKGDRVAGCFFQNWSDGRISGAAMASAMGGAIDGVLAETVLLEESGSVHIPAHMSFEEAATLPCAGLTAWNCLIEQGRLKAGDTVLLLGTGGVSIYGLQIAKMMGARVIITSSSDEKLERARDLGADELINYRQKPDWGARVLEMTDGSGVDVTIETGGGGTLERTMEATRVGGTISLIGVLTGGTINPTTVMRKSIRLQGVYVGSRRMFEDMNAAFALNRIHPVVDQKFEFEEARSAYHAMRAAGHFGKLVVKM